MFTQTAARKTIDWLVQNGHVSEHDRVVYEFGLDKLFSSLVIFFFIVILGLLFGVLLQTVVFYVSYITLRVYAGGYHTEKPITCFFVSIVVLIPCLTAIRLYQAWGVPVIFWGLLMLSVVTLIALGVVEHKNKQLDILEKKVYRRRLLRNLAIISIVAASLAVHSIDSFAVSVLCGILLSTITAVFGKMTILQKLV